MILGDTLAQTMTTDKNRITSYIDDATFEALKIYCDQHQISQSLGINNLLSSALRVEPGTPPSDTFKNQILDQVSQYIDRRFEELKETLKSVTPSSTPRKEKLTLVTDNNQNGQKLTNAELARLIEVRPSTVSRWATGKRATPKNLNYTFDTNLKRWKPKL